MRHSTIEGQITTGQPPNADVSTYIKSNDRFCQSFYKIFYKMISEKTDPGIPARRLPALEGKLSYRSGGYLPLHLRKVADLHDRRRHYIPDTPVVMDLVGLALLAAMTDCRGIGNIWTDLHASLGLVIGLGLFAPVAPADYAAAFLIFIGVFLLRKHGLPT